MKTAVEKINPTRVRLDIEVPFDELKDDFTRAYKTLARQVRIPGFRPGKAPAKILEARIGRAAVIDQVLNDAIPGKYTQALSDSAIKAVGQPHIDIKDIADGQQVSFTAEVDVRPEIQLPDLSQLTVTVDSLPTLESETEKELNELRDRFATVTPQDRPVRDGDLVTIDLSAAIDGTTIDDAHLEDHSYVVGSETLISGLDAALIGAKTDEPVNFESALLAGPHKDKPATITVTVKSVKERELPHLDDSFAQLASEFDSIDELTEDLRAKIAKRLPYSVLSTIEEKALQTLIDSVEFDLPQSLIEEATEQRLDYFSAQFGNDRGVFTAFLAQQGKDYAEFVDEIRKNVAQGVKLRLLLEDIVEAHEITPEPDDIQNEIIRQARQYGISPQEFLQYLLQADGLSMLMAGASRAKAISYILNNVPVVNDNGEKIDVIALTEQIKNQSSDSEALDEGELADESASDDSADDDTDNS